LTIAGGIGAKSSIEEETMNNKRRKIVASVEVGKAQVVSEKHTILASLWF
jgi:hypothetical protein